MRFVAAGAVLLAALSSPGAGGERSGGAERAGFEFDAYNREYVNVRPGASWETASPFKVRMTSPAHRLKIFDHLIELERRPDGAYDSRIRVHFTGDGEVIAEVGMGSAMQTLEDHVYAPDQEVEVRAVLDFRQVEGGFEVEALELPQTVTVRIESELGARMVAVCETAFAFLGIGCSAVETMLSRATVPLPAAGGVYFLSSERLSRAERVRLSRFLKRSE